MFRTTIATLLLTLLVWGGGVVFAQNKSFSQEGQASYYADKFHGRSTASGEKYDKTLFTCAHMTLPYGTNLKVTNLDNKKTVVVRVNDRGPFSPNRIIDVSRAAAEALDIIAKGVAKVRIEITSETPSDPVPVAESEKKRRIRKSPTPPKALRNISPIASHSILSRNPRFNSILPTIRLNLLRRISSRCR